MMPAMGSDRAAISPGRWLQAGVVLAIIASAGVGAPPGVAVATAQVAAQHASRIDAGWAHTCALSDSGRVRCWGRNGHSQLGDGTRRRRFTPVRVANLERDVASIAAGLWHTCALMDSGGVKCWGYGVFGQLGDGTTGHRSTPVDVVGLHGGAVAITAGYSQTCALMDTGGVKCWGATGFGRFSTPTDVPHLSNGVAAISAGGGHTCALTDSGGVVCWGSNGAGQLGDGTTSDSNTPVDVIGLRTGIAAISAGSGYTCVVTEAGGAKCWGVNGNNQLGDGSNESRRTPVDVSGLTSDVVAIATGVDHTCALTGTQGAMCWGENFWGQLGNGTTSNARTPVIVSGTAGGIAAISPGHVHTCALTEGGGAKCWGNNLGGQLGDGSRRERLVPVGVSGLGNRAVGIAAGNEFTCAVTDAGGATCWGWNGGRNDFWLLGNGSRSNRNAPVDVFGLTNGVASISTSYDLTCAVSDAGRAKCWGNNYRGQLGDGTTEPRKTPVRVDGLEHVVGIAAGGDHACALTEVGGVKCWGANYEGQVGDGTTQNRLTPVDVSGLTRDVVAISAGYGYTCALTEAGGVKCWGANYEGQLGDGSTQNRLTPVGVSGLRSGITAISTGESHACAITHVGAATCWGSGPLGDGSSHYAATPVLVPGLSSGVAAISAGSGYTCAIVAARAMCWGANHFGQLGDGTTKPRLAPVDVDGLTSGPVEISAGLEHTCAITDAGRAKCWGDNLYGQIGDGTPTWEPVDVVGFP